MHRTTIVLGFPDYAAQSARLAAALDVPLKTLRIHHFPDGESLVRLPPSVPGHVVICCSETAANDKLVELMLTARTARELGARRLTLVVPYLAYMRQDMAFHPGEAVSQQVIGEFEAGLFDALITVDPHLHRIHRLREAIPLQRIRCLASAPLIGAYVHDQVPDPILVGPDRESEQWVRSIAEPLGLDFAVAEKRRRGDREVEITLPGADFHGRHAVLVDDMASTGRTAAKAAMALRASGAASVDLVVTHALFVGDAVQHCLDHGIDRVWSTDSVPHPSNVIELAPILAAAVEAVWGTSEQVPGEGGLGEGGHPCSS